MAVETKIQVSVWLFTVVVSYITPRYCCELAQFKQIGKTNCEFGAIACHPQMGFVLRVARYCCSEISRFLIRPQ